MNSIIFMSAEEVAHAYQTLQKSRAQLKTELKTILNDLNAPEGNLTEQLNKLWALWEAM